ncbi:MAG: dihydrolipoyl dehydrogenase [Fibrobacteres bacterium]|nr:dihydrolipoyl dehydrogenase [Fibrobacterota bacterium]
MDSSYDIVVIGSGPGGYVAAIKGAQAGKKVAIVEKADLGGICLNWGCIPTKALLKSAEVAHYLKHASEYGLSAKDVSVDYPKVMARSREVAKQNSNGVQFLMKKNKIDVITGTAKLVAKGLLEVSDAQGGRKNIQAGSVIVATGASPRMFPQYPIDGTNFITYRHALDLKDQPKKLLVIGAGAIGVEFAYYFNTLGTEVHLVEMLPQLLPVEDEEISKTLLASFKKQGINCYVGAKVNEVKLAKAGVIEAKLADSAGKEIALTVDRVLVAVGMVPNTKDLGLEQVGVKLDERGFIKVDAYQETSVKGIFAIGDCAGKQLLAHKASAEGEVAVAKILGQAKHGLDYGQIPGCTYCQPQVASVGLTEKACKEKGIAIKIGRFPFSASGKARAIGHTEGMVKLIFGAKYGELLGAHIIGSEATEMLAELGLAMKLESTYEEIMHSIHAHPTLSEAVMEAAMDSQGKSVHI